MRRARALLACALLATGCYSTAQQHYVIETASRESAQCYHECLKARSNVVFDLCLEDCPTISREDGPCPPKVEGLLCEATTVEVSEPAATAGVTIGVIAVVAVLGFYVLMANLGLDD